MGGRRHMLANSICTIVLLLILLLSDTASAASEIPSSGTEKMLRVPSVGWRKMNIRKEGSTKGASLKNEEEKFEFYVAAGFNIRRVRLRSTMLQPPPSPLRNPPRSYIIVPSPPPPLI